MVLDRLFLWIFTLAVLAGTAGIILQVRIYCFGTERKMEHYFIINFNFLSQAPTLYDDRPAITKEVAEKLTSTVVK